MCVGAAAAGIEKRRQYSDRRRWIPMHEQGEGLFHSLFIFIVRQRSTMLRQKLTLDRAALSKAGRVSVRNYAAPACGGFVRAE